MSMTFHIYRPRQFQWPWFWVNRPCGCSVPVSIRFHEPLSCPWARPLCRHGQMFQSTWFGMNQPSGCGVPVSARFQEPLPYPWARPLCHHGQMTMTLHIYRPRRFQWTWFGLNRPSDYWVSASARFQEPLSRPWARPLCHHGQIIMTFHIYRPRQFQWPWFWVNRPCGCSVPAPTRFQGPLSCPWARPLCRHGQMFQWTWFGINQPSGCGVPVSARFQEPLSCPWARPLCHHGQMTMTLHIYSPRKFKWTWFGVNRPRGCWVPASARFQTPLLRIPVAPITPMGMPMWPQWANDYDVTHIDAGAVPMNLIWSELAQWLRGYGPDERTDGRRPSHSPPFLLRKGWGTEKLCLGRIRIPL